MKHLIRALLGRCSVGFPLWQKVALTGAAIVYVVSPVDLLPDVIPILCWGDDAYVIYLLVQVWRSPTLSKAEDNDAELFETSTRRTPLRPTGRTAMVPRERVGGVR